jgi:membrane fusion protein (multidrug efflux system)
MSAATPAAPPATSPPQSASTAAPTNRLFLRLHWLAGLLVLVCLAIFLFYPWWSYRQMHSITADAFVEAHIVNVAPQTVSGHIVRFPAEENDRVKEGDILVELDSEPYQVQVAIKSAAVLEAEKNLTAAKAQARGLAAQTRSNLYKLMRAMEDVNSQISNLSAAVNMLNSKKADLQLAEADLRRGKELLPQRAMSQEAVDTRERAVKADTAASTAKYAVSGYTECLQHDRSFNSALSIESGRLLLAIRWHRRAIE